MIKSISVLGCGWLGFPLAKAFLDKGYKVFGSTTSEEKIIKLRKAGIEPFKISFDPIVNTPDDHFFSTDLLIINIPPKTRIHSAYYHPSQIMNIRDLALKNGTKKVIYVSSTGIYPDLNQVATEDDHIHPQNERQMTLLSAEKILLEQNEFDVLILRCGGLMGYDRQPAKYLAYLIKDQESKRKAKMHPDTPVNYIHQDDVIAIILKLVDQHQWSKDIFNLVAPLHPSRGEFVGLPKKNENLNDLKNSYKIVSSDKIIDGLGYKFIFPDPLRFK